MVLWPYPTSALLDSLLPSQQRDHLLPHAPCPPPLQSHLHAGVLKSHPSIQTCLPWDHSKASAQKPGERRSVLTSWLRLQPQVSWCRSLLWVRAPWLPLALSDWTRPASPADFYVSLGNGTTACSTKFLSFTSASTLGALCDIQPSGVVFAADQFLSILRGAWVSHTHDCLLPARYWGSTDT